jgi:hypothetical protein
MNYKLAKGIILPHPLVGVVNQNYDHSYQTQKGEYPKEKSTNELPYAHILFQTKHGDDTMSKFPFTVGVEKSRFIVGGHMDFPFCLKLRWGHMTVPYHPKRSE